MHELWNNSSITKCQMTSQRTIKIFLPRFIEPYLTPVTNGHNNDRLDSQVSSQVAARNKNQSSTRSHLSLHNKGPRCPRCQLVPFSVGHSRFTSPLDECVSRTAESYGQALRLPFTNYWNGNRSNQRLRPGVSLSFFYGRHSLIPVPKRFVHGSP